MKVFRQSELSTAELGALERQLRSQGFAEAQVGCDTDLGAMEYRKHSRRGPLGDLLGDTWWTISWRPSRLPLAAPDLGTAMNNDYTGGIADAELG